MSRGPARTSHEKKPKSVKEAKEMQAAKKKKRRTRDSWKKGAAGADECQGNMENAIYIV